MKPEKGLSKCFAPLDKMCLLSKGTESLENISTCFLRLINYKRMPTRSGFYLWLKSRTHNGLINNSWEAKCSWIYCTTTQNQTKCLQPGRLPFAVPGAFVFFFFFYKCSRISRRILFATFTVHLENLWGNEVRIAFPYHLNDSIPFNIIKICWAWISLSLYAVILKFYVYLVMFNFFMNLFCDFSARWFFLMPAITKFLVMLDTSKI